MNKRRAVSIAVLAVSAALLAIAIAWQPTGPVAQRPTTGLKVIVVGIDGLDWFLLTHYVEGGFLPTFERLIRSSVRAEVTPIRPTVPDAGWVVLGRGRAPTPEELARLEGTGDRRLFGITPDLVRMAHDAGRSALCVGWPGSWPAAETGPPVAAPYAASPPSHELSIAPAFFVGGPGQASSRELADKIDEVVARSEAEAPAAFARDVYGGPLPADPVWARHAAAAAWGYLADRITLDLAAGLIAEEEPELALVYLGGVDAVEHRFLAPAMPDFFEGDSPPAEFAQILPNYYRFLDEAVKRLLRLADERTLFIVCSVYGVHPSVDAQSVSGSHEDSPPGVLIAWGPNLSAGSGTLTAKPADLAPTALAALGVTVPSEMDGRILVAMLPSGLLEHFPPEYEAGAIPHPETPPAPETDAIDPLVDARLRLLMGMR
jgi:hypothetical protein